MTAATALTAPTPTDPGRATRKADFPSFIEALDYAATCETGLTFYGVKAEPAEALSYRRLRDEAHGVAARLLALGLVPGDRIALLAETDGDFARVFCGAMVAGLVPAPMPLPVAFGAREAYNEQLRRIVGVAGAKAVFAPAAFVEWVSEAMAPLDLLFCGLLKDLPEAGGAPASPVSAPDALAYLQFSSGTTGAPKGIAVTHRSMMANLRSIARDGLCYREGDRGTSWLPLYHDMGLVGCFLSPIATQMSADLFATRDFVRRPLLWLELIAKNRGTMSYAPTFGYDLALRRARGKPPQGLDLSHWRVAGIGGDMIKAPTLRAFAETFGPAGFNPASFTPSYGMAEATLALSFAPLGQGLKTERLDLAALERGEARAPEGTGPARDFALCGPPLPGHQIEVRAEDGTALPEGRVGRLFASGPSLMQGYFGDVAASDDALQDGWLDTGDLGYFRDGQLVVTGRAKDLMIINGRNIWPQDVEWMLERDIEHIREGGVAVFSITPDDGSAHLEEQVIVVAECRLRDAEEREAFREAVRTRAREGSGVDARVALARNGSLPRTSSGKLSRSKARAMLIAGEFDRKT